MSEEYLAIPDELKARPHWVTFEFVQRPDNPKPTKVPKNPRTGTNAAVDNHETWASFEEAVAAMHSRGHAGIGFMFTADDPYCGIDFDDAVDPEDGSVKSWAEASIRELAPVAYLEFSPSGTGIHAITRAVLERGRRLTVKGEDGAKAGGIELYDRGRYFTMTGNRLELP